MFRISSWELLDMKKMKVSKMEGARLAYWVACVENWPSLFWSDGKRMTQEEWMNTFPEPLGWPTVGPILAQMIESGEFCIWEYEGTVTMRNYDPEMVPCKRPINWGQPEICGEGPTLLIAAMRAYVASKFGDDVTEE